MTHNFAPQQPEPAKPTYTPASIAAGCLSLVALMAVGGCVAMAITTSGNSDAPSTDTTPATTTDDGLDEWTETVFTITWDDMSPREQQALCAEVETLGADEAARVVIDQTSEEADFDQNTITEVLTDLCL